MAITDRRLRRNRTYPRRGVAALVHGEERGSTTPTAPATGVANAQVDGADGDDDVGDLDDCKALTFADGFHPNARFTGVSDVVEWVPNDGAVRDSSFSDDCPQ